MGVSGVSEVPTILTGWVTGIALGITTEIKPPAGVRWQLRRFFANYGNGVNQPSSQSYFSSQQQIYVGITNGSKYFTDGSFRATNYDTSVPDMLGYGGVPLVADSVNYFYHYGQSNSNHAFFYQVEVI